MKIDFELYLFGLETADAESMIFVDELDCYDGLGRRLWHCFANAIAGFKSVYCLCIMNNACTAIVMGAGCCGTNDAYAPLPIVFETRRKGRLLGSGATWDYGEKVRPWARTI